MKNLILSLLFTLSLSITTTAQDLSEIYDKVNPAVVEIATEQKELVNLGSTTKTITAGGLGSGFMISNTQVITAAHVVQVAEKINVEFLDGEVIPANVVSSYSTADIALLELLYPRKNAVTVSLGNSDQAKIGSKVFVVGAPFGLGHSFSSGYVSGFKRNIQDKNPFTKYEYIQTDAAINTGNSGGPMFNMNGEVIGIVSNILTKSGGFEGIGFATTSNLTKKLLLEKKPFWSGVEMVPLTGKMANIFNVPQDMGLLAQKVVMSSPFGIIGLKGSDTEIEIGGSKIYVGGDIILAINGIKVELTDESLAEIASMMQERNEGDSIELIVLRDGKIIKLGRQ